MMICEKLIKGKQIIKRDSYLCSQAISTGSLIFLSILGLTIILTWFGCTKEPEDTWSRIVREKVLLVGIDPTYPPFESKDTQTGKLVGFDVDLINAICEQIGVKPEFIDVPFDGIIPGLNDEKYDLIISSMTITPERQKVIDFSEPYYQAGQAIAVRPDEKYIQGVDDLKGKRIGVQLGTTGEMLAKQIPGTKVFSFDAISAAFIDLDNGKIDAIINDRPTTERFIALKGTAKVVGPTLTSESYGIAVRKGESRLLAAINSALESLKLSGEFQVINDKWFAIPTRVQ